MLLEILAFLSLGILAGTLTGLTPGIHVNLISTILLSLPIYVLSPVYFVTFISSMAITHTFLDFIPSVFLGCPDTDTELSVLPGHKLLKNKKGFEAIWLSNVGSIIAIFLLAIIIIPSIFLIKNFSDQITSIIPYLMICVSAVVIFTEKNKRNALIVFFLSGFLGYSLYSLNVTQPLLPLLTGLFGASNIILSIKNETKIPEQEITKTKVSLKRPVLAGLISAPFCSFLPGIGSGQAAVLGNSIVKQDEKGFIVLLGIVNTLVMGFSFISLYAIGKTRTGAALAVKNITSTFGLNYLVLAFLVFLVAGLIAFNLTNLLAKIFSKNFKKINYKKLSYTTLLVLTLVTFLVSGPLGLLILILSTLTGIYCIGLKVRRTNMMGSLIIPTIMFYLGLL